MITYAQRAPMHMVVRVCEVKLLKYTEVKLTNDYYIDHTQEIDIKQTQRLIEMKQQQYLDITVGKNEMPKMARVLMET
jgi:hypothetical protein